MKKFLLLLTFFLAMFSTLVSACDVLDDCNDIETISVSSLSNLEVNHNSTSPNSSTEHHCICSMSCNHFFNSFPVTEVFVAKETYSTKINSFYFFFFEEVYLSLEKPPLV